MLLHATGHKTYYGYISVLGVGSLDYISILGIRKKVEGNVMENI